MRAPGLTVEYSLKVLIWPIYLAYLIVYPIVKWIICSFGYVLFRIGEKVLCISCGINEIAD